MEDIYANATDYTDPFEIPLTRCVNNFEANGQIVSDILNEDVITRMNLREFTCPNKKVFDKKNIATGAPGS